MKSVSDIDCPSAPVDDLISRQHDENHYVKRKDQSSDITVSVIDPVRSFGHRSLVLTKSELLERADRAAKSRAEIARVLGVAPPRITEMFKGERDLSFEEARKLIIHYGIDETSSALDKVSIDDVADEYGFAMIEEVDVTFGLGSTFLYGEPEVKGLVPINLDWLRDVRRGPLSMLKVVRGKGDSMQPTIMDGDIVLIDLSQRTVDEQDRIWAVAYGDLGMVKRLRLTPRSSVMLMSDNQVVQPIEAFDGEMQVLGRVVWIGRRI